jgi:Domain of unknown function (DUF4139)
LNEITISDLTSLADADSIRVSGTTDGHPARINDLTIDLIPNKYAHISKDVDLESESEDEDVDEDPPTLVAAREACDSIAANIKSIDERISAEDRALNAVDKYVSSMSQSSSNWPDPNTMKSAVEVYTTQRKGHFEVLTDLKTRREKLNEDAAKAKKLLEKELRKLQRSTQERVIARQVQKVDREERLREKKENVPEKSDNFYRVRISIDVPAGNLADETQAGDSFQEACLNLTYTTSAASWTPHYDLRLDTTNPSLSTLTYRGHFLNRTFETWSNARITLSTSQASFGGLNEKIPKMEAWRVTIQKSYNTLQPGENGLYSLAEQRIKQEEQTTQNVQLQNMMQQNLHSTMMRGEKMQSLGFKSDALAAQSKSFKKVAKSKSIFGSVGSAALRSSEPSRAVWSATGGSTIADSELEGDGATLAPSGNPITHPTAGLDTYGFTTTYELPTPRTIPSSPLVRRHVIAEIQLPSLVFTYILIPKLKPAAFLKARLVNTSDVPLLPGLAGLTLDGSFLGNLSFPRASPEETVVLELGVDQGLKVEYDRPMMKHSTQGMIGFGKEVGSYKRMMRLTNTKSTSVSVVVLDQIPVPEDERLKIAISVPPGLANENDTVKNGVGVDGKVAVKKKPMPIESGSLKSGDEKAGSVRGSNANVKREITVTSASKYAACVICLVG